MSGIDHRDTWTVKAVLRDGALGQRTERPNLVSRCLGRCPRSPDRIDQTWSTGAWDGALGQRTDRPNLVYRCLGRCPWCAGPDRTRQAAKPAEPLRAAKPAGLSASTFRKLLGRLPDREVNPRTRPIETNTRAGQRLPSTSKRRTTA